MTELLDRARRAAAWARRRQNILIFVGGFLFDAFTLRRIDSWVDLAVQLAYLLGLTALIVGQHRAAAGLWTPLGAAARVWHWNVEALHFFYGGLLSNYVVLYAKSTAGLGALAFFSLLVALLFINEMPAIRRFGHRLRLGLYAFCVTSFLIYFVPILAGRMGDGWFFLSLILSGGVVWGVSGLLTRESPAAERLSRRRRLAWPAAAVLSLIATLYVLRLVPPVPLSVQFDGLYHGVEKTNGSYVLRWEKPPFYRFWRRDSRPFRMRPGDKMFYFARVFAPSRFRHAAVIRWERRDAVTGVWKTHARVLLSVSGGREEGYRGYSYIEVPTPGRWRAGVETQDGRVVGRRAFTVLKDERSGDRRWREMRM